MRREIVKPVTLSSLAELKPRWGVSIGSLIERAFSLAIITVDQRKYLWKQMNLNGWKMREPPNLDIEAERPRALKRMAELLYAKKDGSIDYKKLARDTAMPVTLVGEILNAHSPQVPAGPCGELRHFPTKPETVNSLDDLLANFG
jgi:hypothetical protein